MNDEFLHALRRDPPPGFARELQRRLQRMPAPRSTRSSVLRTLLAVFAIGGVAMAAALLLRNRDEPASVDVPTVQHQAAPSAPTSAPQPALTSSGDRQIPGDPSAASEPETEESGSAEITPRIATSEFVQPLAKTLLDYLSRYQPSIAPQPLTLGEAEAFSHLCEGLDFVFASRRMEQAELTRCNRFGAEIVEWHIGYQAVVLTAGPMAQPAALTPREVFLALARRIPDPANPAQLIDNSNATWRDVDARFDTSTINVLAPADPVTRRLFAQLVMEPGCETYPWIRSLRQTNRRLFDDICHQVRTDGRYHEVALTSTFVTQQLWAEPSWLVVLGYNYYADHRTELLGTMLEGPAPTPASLADGTYAAARPVYVYGNANSKRRYFTWSRMARELAYSLTDEYTVGPQGYLTRHGLVPLDEAARRKQREERSK